MFRSVLATLALFLFFFLPATASAHFGNGPPFMKINGTYSQTNPYNQGSATLIMSWDSAPATYLVNKPVTFEIDLPVLMAATTVPQAYMKDIKLRWSVATGDNFENKDTNYAEGATFTKTFTKPGSYLVIVEAKLPADTEYILINTVQTDILPTSSYKPPAPSAYVGTAFNDPGKNILLVSDSLTDPSTKVKKYMWDFGDGQLREGATIDRKFQRVNDMGTETIFHRVIDENGFMADLGFVASKVGDQLRFEPFASGKPLPVVVVTREEAAEKAGKPEGFKLSLGQFIASAVGVLFLAGLAWVWVLKKEKKTKKRHHSI